MRQLQPSTVRGGMLITTKKGKAGTLNLTISASLGVSKLARPLNVLSAADFRREGTALNGLQRTDLNRFGKYENTWTEKNNTNVRKRIFPIPQMAIDGASNSPGYLTQNGSY